MSEWPGRVPSSTAWLSLGRKIASNRIVAAEKRAAKHRQPPQGGRRQVFGEQRIDAGRRRRADERQRRAAAGAGRGGAWAGLRLVRRRRPRSWGEPAGIRRRAGSRVLVVPVGVRFQEAAGQQPVDEPPLVQSVGLGDRGRGRVGDLQQQSADLGAGELPVRQGGGDGVQRSAFALAVERETVELGEFAVEFASVAPRPGAFRVAREKGDAPRPQPVCVAFNRAGPQPEGSRERQTAHLVLH